MGKIYTIVLALIMPLLSTSHLHAIDKAYSSKEALVGGTLVDGIDGADIEKLINQDVMKRAAKPVVDEAH